MVRFLVLFAVVSVVLTVYAVIDCAMTDARRSRALAKPAWLLVVIVVPVVGPLLWLVFGKIRGGAVTRETAPDDDDDFLRSIGISTEIDSRSDAERRAQSLPSSSSEPEGEAGVQSDGEDADASGPAPGSSSRETPAETSRDERDADDDPALRPDDGDDDDERDGRADGSRGRSARGRFARGPRGSRDDGPAPHDAAPHLPGDDSQAPRV